MTNNNFIENVKRGNVGERFVEAHINELCDAILLNQREYHEDHVEGADEMARRLILGNPIDDFLPDYIDMPELLEGTSFEVQEYLIGGVEVKTTWNYLAATYDRENESGTIPVALWSSETRSNPGWLPKLLHPERYEVDGEIPVAVQPHTILFILAAYENAFASIAFEDVPALLDRLRSLARGAGVDLDDGIPYGEQAQDWSPENMVLFGNMWPVALSDVQDLARVTLIGTKPRIRPDIYMQDRSCTSYTQEKRYMYLAELAGDRHISIEEEYRDCFTPSQKRKIFADIDHNLSILDNFEDEKYPALAKYRRKRVFDHLKGLMLYMLAQEFPEYLNHSQRYFVIGKIQLEDWCKRHGIPGSTKSWQGSLVFLRDCGLIKCFRPKGDLNSPCLARIYSSMTPINGKYPSLRSVPRYDDDILANAEHIARIYFENHIIIAKMTKADVIRCRGREIANQLYLDDRTITQEEMYVHDIYINLLIHFINTQGYADKDSILEQIKTKMRNNMHFQNIDRDHILTENEENELARQEPYWRAYFKMTERTAQLAAERGYRYHPTRRIDKDALHLPDTFNKWIIT